MKITGHKHSIGTLFIFALLSGSLTLFGGSPAFADNDHRDRNDKRWEEPGEQSHKERQKQDQHRKVVKKVERQEVQRDRLKRPDPVVRSALRPTVSRERTIVRTVSRSPERQGVRDYRRPRTLHRPEVRHTPRKEVIVRTLPRGSRTVVINRERYHVHGGRYYRYSPRGYLLVRPPLGTIIAELPFGYLRVSFGGLDYFVLDNVFYRHTVHGYQVVPTPAGYEETDYGPVRVVAPILNIRTGPGLGYGTIGRLQQGELLVVTAVTPDWYYVLLPNGEYGWVMSRHTSMIARG